jgi:hypothetical protein
MHELVQGVRVLGKAAPDHRVQASHHQRWAESLARNIAKCECNLVWTQAENIVVVAGKHLRRSTMTCNLPTGCGSDLLGEKPLLDLAGSFQVAWAQGGRARNVAAHRLLDARRRIKAVTHGISPVA